LNIVSKINYGYENIEPVIIAMMAVEKNILLIGRHGSGKTRLAKYLSMGYEQDKFVFYDATKDDMISIAGLPDPEAMKKGKIEFIPHERTIWDKTTIVIDEITRATKETQNLYLSILEERNLFGKQLVYKTLIATANPESYAAANKLDEALLDRFYAVIKIPEFSSIRSEDAKKIMEMNLIEPDIKKEELVDVFEKIKSKYDELKKDEKTKNMLMEYASQFISLLISHIKTNKIAVYLSPRSFARNYIETLFALSAYYSCFSKGEPFVKAAIDAYQYALMYKLIEVDLKVFQNIHKNLEHYLKSDLKSKQKVKALETEIFEARSKGIKKFLEFLNTKREEIEKQLDKESLDHIVNHILRVTSKDRNLFYRVDIAVWLGLITKQNNNKLLKRVDPNLINDLKGSLKMTINNLFDDFYELIKECNEEIINEASSFEEIRIAKLISTFTANIDSDGFSENYSGNNLFIKKELIRITAKLDPAKKNNKEIFKKEFLNIFSVLNRK